MRSHRKDEVYGIGGYDPDHPTGNVLDEFDHGQVEHIDEGPPMGLVPGVGKTVTVRHYDRHGKQLTERTISDDEKAFFFPKKDARIDVRAAAAVHGIAAASIADRI